MSIQKQTKRAVNSSAQLSQVQSSSNRLDISEKLISNIQQSIMGQGGFRDSERLNNILLNTGASNLGIRQSSTKSGQFQPIQNFALAGEQIQPTSQHHQLKHSLGLMGLSQNQQKQLLLAQQQLVRPGAQQAETKIVQANSKHQFSRHAALNNNHSIFGRSIPPTSSMKLTGNFLSTKPATGSNTSTSALWKPQVQQTSIAAPQPIQREASDVVEQRYRPAIYNGQPQQGYSFASLSPRSEQAKIISNQIDNKTSGNTANQIYQLLVQCLQQQQQQQQEGSLASGLVKAEEPTIVHGSSQQDQGSWPGLAQISTGSNSLNVNQQLDEEMSGQRHLPQSSVESVYGKNLTIVNQPETQQVNLRSILNQYIEKNQNKVQYPQATQRVLGSGSSQTGQGASQQYQSTKVEKTGSQNLILQNGAERQRIARSMALQDYQNLQEACDAALKNLSNASLAVQDEFVNLGGAAAEQSTQRAMALLAHNQTQLQQPGQLSESEIIQRLHEVQVSLYEQLLASGLQKFNKNSQGQKQEFNEDHQLAELQNILQNPQQEIHEEPTITTSAPIANTTLRSAYISNSQTEQQIRLLIQKPAEDIAMRQVQVTEVVAKKQSGQHAQETEHDKMMHATTDITSIERLDRLDGEGEEQYVQNTQVIAAEQHQRIGNTVARIAGPNNEISKRQIHDCPHTDRKYYAKGMCANCYHRRGRSKKAWACPHPRKTHYSKGLCKYCYLSNYYKSRTAKGQPAHQLTPEQLRALEQEDGSLSAGLLEPTNQPQAAPEANGPVGAQLEDKPDTALITESLSCTSKTTTQQDTVLESKKSNMLSQSSIVVMPEGSSMMTQN